MNTFHIPTWGWQIYISKKKRCVFQNYETQYTEPPQNGVNPTELNSEGTLKGIQDFVNLPISKRDQAAKTDWIHRFSMNVTGPLVWISREDYWGLD